MYSVSTACLEMSCSYSIYQIFYWWKHDMIGTNGKVTAGCIIHNGIQSNPVFCHVFQLTEVYIYIIQKL